MTRKMGGGVGGEGGDTSDLVFFNVSLQYLAKLFF